MRIKVACINWGHPDAPHALSYVLDPILGPRGEFFHATWAEAMDRARMLAGMPRAPHDPTHGRIDRDIQAAVHAMGPDSLGQRVALENTLQAKRDRGERVVLDA